MPYVGDAAGRAYRYDQWYDRTMAMKEKKIIDGQFPSYSFRLDPETVRELERLKGKDGWNKLFKELIKKFNN